LLSGIRHDCVIINNRSQQTAPRRFHQLREETQHIPRKSNPTQEEDRQNPPVLEKRFLRYHGMSIGDVSRRLRKKTKLQEKELRKNNRLRKEKSVLL
jgi:hypothetical protein